MPRVGLKAATAMFLLLSESRLFSASGADVDGYAKPLQLPLDRRAAAFSSRGGEALFPRSASAHWPALSIPWRISSGPWRLKSMKRSQ